MALLLVLLAHAALLTGLVRMTPRGTASPPAATAPLLAARIVETPRSEPVAPHEGDQGHATGGPSRP